MSDGVKLNADIWKPHGAEKVYVVLGFHCYHSIGQAGPIKPAALSTAQWRNTAQERTNASLESGDPRGLPLVSAVADHQGQCLEYFSIGSVYPECIGGTP